MAQTPTERRQTSKRHAPELELDVELVRSYLARSAPVRVLALEFGFTYRGLQRRLKRAGLTPRPRLPVPACATCGGRVSGRTVSRCRECLTRAKPAPRPCEGCGRLFVPSADKLARGRGGRFHSYACWNAWRTGRPQREWRAISSRSR